MNIDKNLIPSRKMTEEEVLSFIARFATEAPAFITLSDIMPMLIEHMAEISDRLTLQQSSRLISLFGIVAKYSASQPAIASTPIKIEKGMMQ